jgi:hypothetical protein
MEMLWFRAKHGYKSFPGGNDVLLIEQRPTSRVGLALDITVDKR